MKHWIRDKSGKKTCVYERSGNELYSRRNWTRIHMVIGYCLAYADHSSTVTATYPLELGNRWNIWKYLSWCEWNLGLNGENYSKVRRAYELWSWILILVPSMFHHFHTSVQHLHPRSITNSKYWVTFQIHSRKLQKVSIRHKPSENTMISYVQGGSIC